MLAIQADSCGSTSAVKAAARQLLGHNARDFNSKERLSLMVLAAARQKLVVEDGGVLDVQSEKGCAGCQRFLSTLEGLAAALGLEPAARTYRGEFSGNYRALFFAEERSYRVDILEAAITLTPAIWANGEAVQLSDEAIECADTLREIWYELGYFLDEWMLEARPPEHVRQELCERLTCLDAAWASFEQAYVGALLRVQQRARGLISEAAQQERRLWQAERAATAGSGGAAANAANEVEGARRWAEIKLLAHLDGLCIASNTRPSGNTRELSVETLYGAREILAGARQCLGKEQHGAPDPAVVLASHAVECFSDLRDYLRKVRNHLDKVHPQLSRNVGLAEKLARLQESWGRSEHLGRSPELMEAARRLVRFLWASQLAAPALRLMCEDRDAELFLVLPRLVCLCLWMDSDGPVATLLQEFLPLRSFATERPDGAAEDTRVQVHEAAAALRRALAAAGAAIAASAGGALDESQAAAHARDYLVRRLVAGRHPAVDKAAATVLFSPLDEAATEVEGLMNEVESWSMELQRHNAEAWNDFSDLLVQCILWQPCRQKPLRAKFVI